MITPAAVKTRFPEFAAVPDATVSAIITEVYANWVDASWGTREDTGAMYMTGHLLATGGWLAISDDGAMTTTRGAMTSDKLGDASRSWAALSGADMSSMMGWLNSTAYGRLYAALLMALKRGPRVV